MTRRPGAGRGAPVEPLPPPLPGRHPATVAAALAAAACVIVSASYVLYDTDLWTLLAGGRAIWSGGGVPRADLWTWRHFGEPMALSSWLYRAILWPVWSAGEVWGLYALRWATALAVFGMVWAVARALGARGLTALVVVVWAALVHRLRTDIRPETLAALLLATALWILETRRRGGPDRAWWLAPIVAAWVNLHVSYYLALVLIAIYWADAAWRARRDPRAQGGARRLALAGAAAALAALVNPFGWRLAAQPFEFALFWRDDPMFRAIAELHPVVWSANLRNGLPLMMASWPALLLWRLRRRGPDPAEILLCASFTALAWSSQRFVATYALVAAPFIAGHLEALVLARRWRRPAGRAWRGAAACAAASIAISLPEWSRPELPLGVGLDLRQAPERACDFIARHGVRGRGFGESHLGGYQAYRFSPDPGRLPFIGTQPEYATPEDRRLYIASYRDPAAWRELDGRYRFDYLLLARDQGTGNLLLDALDRDTTWIMVFTDDAAQVLVRRHGPFADLARRFGYRVLPAGREMRERLIAACAGSPALRAAAAAELARAADSSEWNGSAHHMLGFLAAMDRRFDEARAHLERARALKPRLASIRDQLARLPRAAGARDSTAARAPGP